MLRLITKHDVIVNNNKLLVNLKKLKLHVTMIWFTNIRSKMQEIERLKKIHECLFWSFWFTNYSPKIIFITFWEYMITLTWFHLNVGLHCFEKTIIDLSMIDNFF